MHVEERSFAPAEVRRVGEWKSPNLLGMSNEERDGALLDSLAQLHRCVETGHRKADTARARQGRALKAVQGDVQAVQGDVVEVKDALRKLQVSMGLEEPRPGEPRQVAIVHAQHPPGVMSWSPKKLFAAVAAVVGGVFAAVQALALAIQATDWSGVAETVRTIGDLIR